MTNGLLLMAAGLADALGLDLCLGSRLAALAALRLPWPPFPFPSLAFGS